MTTQQTTYTDAQFRAMARFWTAAIESGKMDNGATDSSNRLARRLAEDLARREKPDAAKLSVFADALVVGLRAHPWREYERPSLTCDYHPDRLLAAAADAAGINHAVFPWKSSVRIDEHGRVLGSCGYRAPAVEIHCNEG